MTQRIKDKLAERNPEPEKKLVEIDKLGLLSGHPLLVKELNLIIHQPLLRDVSTFGENEFFRTYSTLVLTRSKIDTEESGITEEELALTTDMQWVMTSCMSSDSREHYTKLFLGMILPDYDIELSKENMNMSFTHKNFPIKEKAPRIVIDSDNLQIFQTVLKILFSRGSSSVESEYNVQSAIAKRIAAKLKESKERIQLQKPAGKKIESVLASTVSSLAVALQLPVRTIFEKYTIPQLYDQVERFEKRDKYLRDIQSIFAGAEDVEIESWYEEQ